MQEFFAKKEALTDIFHFSPGRMEGRLVKVTLFWHIFLDLNTTCSICIVCQTVTNQIVKLCYYKLPLTELLNKFIAQIFLRTYLQKKLLAMN